MCSDHQRAGHRILCEKLGRGDNYTILSCVTYLLTMKNTRILTQGFINLNDVLSHSISSDGRSEVVVGFAVVDYDAQKQRAIYERSLATITSFAAHHLDKYPELWNVVFTDIASKLSQAWNRSPEGAIELSKATANWLKQNLHRDRGARDRGVFPPEHWAKATGCPTWLVLFFERLMDSNIPKDQKRLATRILLSYLDAYRVTVVPKQPDLTPVTKEFTGNAEFINLLEVRQALIDLGIDLEDARIKLSEAYKNRVYHTSNKVGPNGHALWSAHVDAQAILQDEKVANNLRSFCGLVDSMSIVEDLESCAKCPPVFMTSDEPGHSKLAVIYENGNKARIVAIIDYWTQEALWPLHDVLSDILKDIPMDSTHDQDAGAERVKTFTSSRVRQGVYSFDLSSATDRLPVALQARVLDELFGIEGLGEAWMKLLTQRGFRTGLGGKIEYEVGQPMGARSSFPMLALTHHVIVKIAARQAGQSDYQDYAILGDDIVVCGKDVAERYESIMDTLGLEISQPKTIKCSPSSAVATAEFCRRLFYNGTEISPLPVKLIHRVCEQHQYSYQLQEELYKRDLLIDGRFHTFLFDLLNDIRAFDRHVEINYLPQHCTGMKSRYHFPGLESMDSSKWTMERNGMTQIDYTNFYFYTIVTSQLQRINALLSHIRSIDKVILKSLHLTGDSIILMPDGQPLHKKDINLKVFDRLGLISVFHPAKAAVKNDIQRVDDILSRLVHSDDQGRQALMHRVVDQLRIHTYDFIRDLDAARMQQLHAMVDKMRNLIDKAKARNLSSLVLNIKIDTSPFIYFVKVSLGGKLILRRNVQGMAAVRTSGAQGYAEYIKSRGSAIPKSSSDSSPAPVKEPTKDSREGGIF